MTWPIEDSKSMKISFQRIAALEKENQSSELKQARDKESPLASSTTEAVQLLTRIEDLESELERKKQEVC